MAITRERKEELLAIYGELLSQATGVVFTEYRAITVAQIKQVRTKLREVEGAYMVTKNTLFGKALADAGWPVPTELLNGQTAVVFGASNFPAVAKATMGLLKDFEDKLTIKGGIMNGALLTPAQVEVVSNLPSLEELRAQLAGLIVQPASGIAGVLNAVAAGVPSVLQAYVSKHEAAA